MSDKYSKQQDKELDEGPEVEWKETPPYAPLDPKNPKDALYHGSCHCKNVKFALFAKPMGAQFCHCDDCQKLHGSPAHWSAVFEKEDVLFTTPPENLAFYRTSDQGTTRELPCKITCARCHSPICDEGKNKMLMYPSLIDFNDRTEREPFLPERHVFYKMRAIDVHDGNPKFEGLQNETPLMDEDEHHGEEGVTGERQKKRPRQE